MDVDKMLEILQADDDQTSFHSENGILAPLLDEIDLIKDQALQYFVRSVLLYLEDFWDSPIPDTDDHPSDEKSTGGVVLHTKRVVRTAMLLSDSYMVEDWERDLITAACILHDITRVCHYDDDTYSTDAMHPYTVGAMVDDIRKDSTIFSSESQSNPHYIREDTVSEIMRLIRCHMGPWGAVPETLPMTVAEMVVHLSDTVASKLHKIVGEEVWPTKMPGKLA